jgi:2-oxoglutarate ferredoxin oxidoreductase subunit beta
VHARADPACRRPLAKLISDPVGQAARVIRIFGKNRDKGIRLTGFDLEVVQLGNGITEKDLLVHDEHHPRPAYAFLLSHMELRPGFPTPIGVLRSWDNVPRYEDVSAQQIQAVIAKRGKGDIAKLLRTGDTWTVQ